MNLNKVRVHNAVALVLAALAVPQLGSAQGAQPIDLSTWTAESYPVVSGFPPGSWSIAPDGLSAVQHNNGQPTLFCSDFNAQGTRLEGAIAVETTGDDDFIGFALGYQLGDISNPSADYLLLDWKQGDQWYDLGAPSCTPGSTAFAGLAVSRVTGIPTADEFWGHLDFNWPACSPLGDGLTELARATTRGNVGWTDWQTFTFAFEFTSTSLRVFVDGTPEIDITGSFADGSFCFYNFSQSLVRYSGFTVESLICEPHTQGFWKRQCSGSHPSGEHENLPDYVSCVQTAATFDDVFGVDDLCDRLHPDPPNAKCEQAEAQFMALLLNVCSGRLGRFCCLDLDDSTATTVAQAIAEIDALLSGAPSRDDCVLAQSIAAAINEAAALCPETPR